MNNEVKIRNWVYKNLGNFGAYIIETNGECFKRTDVTYAKKYIEDLTEENKQLKEKVNQLETNINEAIEYLKRHDQHNGDNYFNLDKYMWDREIDILEILKGGSND